MERSLQWRTWTPPSLLARRRAHLNDRVDSEDHVGLHNPRALEGVVAFELRRLGSGRGSLKILSSQVIIIIPRLDVLCHIIILAFTTFTYMINRLYYNADLIPRLDQSYAYSSSFVTSISGVRSFSAFWASCARNSGQPAKGAPVSPHVVALEVCGDPILAGAQCLIVITTINCPGNYC